MKTVVIVSAVYILCSESGIMRFLTNANKVCVKNFRNFPVVLLKY